MSQFYGLVALITGASSGIGAEVAKEFARKGALLVLLARRTERLNAIAMEIDPSGEKVLAIPCDVSVDDEVKKAASLALIKFGRIDIVMKNAGWSLKGELAELNVHDYRKLFATNVFGVLNTIYATLDELKKTQGRLAVISSVKSYLSLSGDSPYSMSKFALRALCESLSQELKPDGVSVIHICPGYVATEIRQIDNQGVWRSDWQDNIPSSLLISSSQAAKEIVQAVSQRKKEIAIPNYSKIIIFLKRHLPGLVAWVILRFKIRVSYKM
ncbi:MAG: SDR family NAD(P)-dependent oxidoreductase [Scytonematopsis contorta HA4267-MV1]|jgi:short-subunit dehydrogenase|nr:SDR family NAD(P)-dependent oxidoreductase [Scytonematopsis contorta HA4267-MV1]